MLALERHQGGLAAELTCAFIQTSATPTPLHNWELIKFGYLEAEHFKLIEHFFVYNALFH